VLETTTNSPLIVRNADELADAVRQAADSAIPLVDYGVAHDSLGHPPPDPHTRLRLQADDPVVEHYAGDMSVLAAAGGTLAALNQQLKSANQFIPIDADDDLTLGEVINHNVYGPLRVGFLDEARDPSHPGGDFRTGFDVSITRLGPTGSNTNCNKSVIRFNKV